MRVSQDINPTASIVKTNTSGAYDTDQDVGALHLFLQL